MKKIVLGIIALFVFIPVAKAAPGYTFTVGNTRIENGSSVTATVRVTSTAAWNIKITSSGNTTGCTSSFADATANGQNTTKSFSVTCKSNSIGVIGFTLTGDITSSDGANIPLSGSKSVTVTAVTPKSTNNNLATLGIEGFTLTPEFSKETLEYSLEVPAGTEKVNITGSVEDRKSSVAGLGEITVTEGLNSLEVVVTAENGTTKKYLINLTVKELDPIYVTVDNKQYALVRKEEALTKPALFIDKTVEIEGEEIPAFYSEATKVTLVGLKDEAGNIKLYIYNETKKSYTLYEEVTFGGVIFSVLSTDKTLKNFEKSTIKINGIEVDCLRHKKDNNFILLYGMNMENANEGFYIYDKDENTLQKYNEDFMAILDKQTNLYLFVAIGFAALVLILILVVIKSSRKNKKYKKFLEKIDGKTNNKVNAEKEKLEENEETEEIRKES